MLALASAQGVTLDERLRIIEAANLPLQVGTAKYPKAAILTLSDCATAE